MQEINFLVKLPEAPLTDSKISLVFPLKILYIGEF